MELVLILVLFGALVITLVVVAIRGMLHPPAVIEPTVVASRPKPVPDRKA